MEKDIFRTNGGWPTVGLVIQKKGDRGKPSLTLYSKAADGTHVALETSDAMLKMIADVASNL